MLVIGCQRSGLMTCAEVFRLQHEVQFMPYTSWQRLPKIVCNLKPEASWLAVPFLKTLKSYTNVLHVVRHPLKVIGSMEGIEFWHTHEHKLYRDFIYKYMVEVSIKCNALGFRDLPSIEKSMFYWLYWNIMCEGYPRLRIEDFAGVPRLNKRKRKDLDWNDLPEGSLRDSVIAKMEEYGYE